MSTLEQKLISGELIGVKYDPYHKGYREVYDYGDSDLYVVWYPEGYVEGSPKHWYADLDPITIVPDGYKFITETKEGLAKLNRKPINRFVGRQSYKPYDKRLSEIGNKVARFFDITWEDLQTDESKQLNLETLQAMEIAANHREGVHQIKPHSHESDTEYLFRLCQTMAGSFSSPEVVKKHYQGLTKYHYLQLVNAINNYGNGIDTVSYLTKESKNYLKEKRKDDSGPWITITKNQIQKTQMVILCNLDNETFQGHATLHEKEGVIVLILDDGSEEIFDVDEIKLLQSLKIDIESTPKSEGERMNIENIENGMVVSGITKNGDEFSGEVSNVSNWAFLCDGKKVIKKYVDDFEIENGEQQESPKQSAPQRGRGGRGRSAPEQSAPSRGRGGRGRPAKKPEPVFDWVVLDENDYESLASGVKVKCTFDDGYVVESVVDSVDGEGFGCNKAQSDDKEFIGADWGQLEKLEVWSEVSQSEPEQSAPQRGRGGRGRSNGAAGAAQTKPAEKKKGGRGRPPAGTPPMPKVLAEIVADQLEEFKDEMNLDNLATYFEDAESRAPEGVSISPSGYKTSATTILHYENYLKE